MFFKVNVRKYPNIKLIELTLASVVAIVDFWDLKCSSCCCR
jgi:hypothetical protein